MSKAITKSDSEGKTPSVAPVAEATEKTETTPIAEQEKTLEESPPPAPHLEDVGGLVAPPIQNNPRTIVIAAYPNSEDLLRALWQKFMPDNPPIVVVNNDSLADIFPLLIADDNISDDFIFVPANCAPVALVDINDLMQQKVYVYNDGSRHFAEPLPMLLKKTALVELLGHATESMSDEELLSAYASQQGNGARPMEVSHDFGNFVTLVQRSNPCENVVIAGLCQKKFVSTSAEGWDAIANLLTKIL